METQIVQRRKEVKYIETISQKVIREDKFILDKILNDPVSINYFTSASKFAKMIKSLSNNKIEIVVQFNQESKKNQKTLRKIIKDTSEVGESTISHSLSKLMKSGLFKESDGDELPFTKFGEILLDELNLLIRNLTEKDKIPNIFSYLGRNIIKPLSNKINIFTIKSLSYNSVNFSDLLDRVNIMLKISKGNKKLKFSSDFSYHLGELKKTKIIDKKENKYILTEMGELLHEFFNAVLLKIIDNERNKHYLLKKIRDFSHIFNEIKELLCIYKKDLKKDRILDLCNMNPIVLSNDNNYLGIISPFCPQLITSYWIRDDWEESDYLSKIILKIPPINMEDSLFNALFIMRENNLKSIPVAEGNRIVATFDLNSFSKIYKL